MIGHAEMENGSFVICS